MYYNENNFILTNEVFKSEIHMFETHIHTYILVIVINIDEKFQTKN